MFPSVREVEGEAVVGRGDVGRPAFDAFFAGHYRELARFAYLLTGDPDAADDVTAEAMAETWKNWARVASADWPLAYVRRIVANIAGARTARLVRERRSWRLWSAGRSEQSEVPDTDAAVDLRQLLLRLPARKRACVVLRYYYGLSERETAETLGVAVGTVKSQSSRGLEELSAQLRGSRSALSAARGGNRRSTAQGARQ
jgi:RNA polymerase sigma-70 factor (sigma-E family)